MENTNQEGALKPVPKAMHIKESRKEKVNVGWTRLEKKDTMIKAVIEEEPIGKRPLSRLRLRWEDCVKKDVETVDPGTNWMDLAED